MEKEPPCPDPGYRKYNLLACEAQLRHFKLLTRRAQINQTNPEAYIRWFEWRIRDLKVKQLIGVEDEYV